MVIKNLPQIKEIPDETLIPVSPDKTHINSITKKDLARGLIGSGGGMQYWTETEDSIYNKSEGETVDPTWGITERKNIYGTVYQYDVFDGYVNDFNISNKSQWNGQWPAMAAALSYCYPCINGNKEQPEDFYFPNTPDFGDVTYNITFHEVQIYGKHLQNLKLWPNDVSYIDMTAARYINPKAYLTDHLGWGWYSSVYTELKYPYERYYNAIHRDPLEANKSYIGIIYLNIYNNANYGDIAGLRGYNKDYCDYCKDEVLLCLAQIKKLLIDNQLDEEEILYNIKLYLDNIDRLAPPSTEEMANNILNIFQMYDYSSSYKMEIIMICNNHSEYTPETFMNAVYSVLDSTGYDFDPTQHSQDINRKKTNISSGSLSYISASSQQWPKVAANGNIRSIKTICEEETEDPETRTLYALIHDIEYQINTSGFEVTEWDAVLHPYAMNITPFLEYQPDEDTTYDLVRDHESEYLSFNRRHPFFFKVYCLGRIFDNPGDGNWTSDIMSFLNEEFPDYTMPITLGNGEYKIQGSDGENYTVVDYDADSHSTLYNVFEYSDRTLAQGGVFMDDDGICWYVGLTPAKRLFYWLDDIAEEDEPYFNVTGRYMPNFWELKGKQPSVLDLGETPNHWSYYNGANPLDEVKTYTKTHNNGHTYTFNLSSLSRNSRQTYNENFMALARKIVNGLGLMALKPFFGDEASVQIQTNLLVNNDDHTAFSAGIAMPGDAFVPKVTINGETGNIWSNGEVNSRTVQSINVTASNEINSPIIKANNVDISSIYQEKLTAGDNITIENNVISASGGGGGGGGADYKTTPHIVGTWIDGRNVYEITLYRSSWSTSLYLTDYIPVKNGTIDKTASALIVGFNGSFHDGSNTTTKYKSWPANYNNNNGEYTWAIPMFLRYDNNSWRIRVEYNFSFAANYCYPIMFTIRYVLPEGCDPNA